MSTDHLRCRQIISEKNIQATSPLKTVWHDRNGGFLKWGLQHSFNSLVISLGGNERICHLMMIELCKQSMSDALLSSRLSCSSLLWSPEGNPAPIFGLSEKGLPWIPKFLKSNGSIMILPSLSDRLTMGYPISVYTRRQWHVDILSLSLSHSLSLSPRLESSRESLCRLVPFSSEMIECTVRSLPLLWSSIFTFLTTASKLEAGKLDRYSPRYFDGIKLRSLTMSY